MLEQFLINFKCIIETSIYVIEDLLFEVIELKPQIRKICSRGNFFVMVRWLRERFMKNDPSTEFNLVVVTMSVVSQIWYYYMLRPVCNFFFLIFEMRSSNWLHLYRCIFFEKSQYMYKFIDVEVYFRSGSFNYFSELQSYKCRTITECKDLLHSNSRWFGKPKKMVFIELFLVDGDLENGYKINYFENKNIKYYHNFAKARGIIPRIKLTAVLESIKNE